MASSNTGEPSTAPQPNRWYDLRLGSSCRDPALTTKFCTLRYEFKPASIDKTQAGSLQKSKDNRVTVEFHNNQPGRPKVAFEGSQEEYKDNDGVLFFDGETFRLERLHRAVKRLRHVRVPGESVATSLAATTTGMGESHSPPLAKVGKLPATNKPSIHSVPVEVEHIDIGEPENPGPRNSNRSSKYQPVTTDPFSSSPDPNDQDENLDILGDDDNGSPNNMASAQETSYRGFDINLPNQLDMDDEVADVDVNDEAEEGLNAAEALRAQVNAEGQQVEQATSSSSGSSSGSGSGSGSSTSGSDGSDGDSPSSGGDVDI
ncbi:ell-associated factor Eaf [Triticum urartu]|uniref:Transcription elongation factor Eaf N-terminal domain-containing protein n=2 Tax=Triticum urartu TaxID=4572 RepID=A0A8R7URX2_TRIUA|nr:ell-associated factor Eaf [Triticum urartu]